MVVEIDGVAEGRVFLTGFEEGKLFGGCRFWSQRLGGATDDAVTIGAHGSNDRLGVDAFVDVERHRRNLKTGPFGFAGPDELRIEVGVVGVGFSGFFDGVGVGRDEADGRVIHPLFVGMRIRLDPFLGRGRRRRRRRSWSPRRLLGTFLLRHACISFPEPASHVRVPRENTPSEGPLATLASRASPRGRMKQCWTVVHAFIMLPA